MKAALILTGNIRTFEQCIQSFEQLISKYDLDIFICTSNIQNDLHPFSNHHYIHYNVVNHNVHYIHVQYRIQHRSNTFSFILFYFYKSKNSFSECRKYYKHLYVNIISIFSYNMIFCIDNFLFY